MSKQNIIGKKKAKKGSPRSSKAEFGILHLLKKYVEVLEGARLNWSGG